MAAESQDPAVRLARLSEPLAPPAELASPLGGWVPGPPRVPEPGPPAAAVEPAAAEPAAAEPAAAEPAAGEPASGEPDADEPARLGRHVVGRPPRRPAALPWSSSLPSGPAIGGVVLVGALLLGGLYLGTRPAAEEPADLVLPAASAVAVEPLASAGEPAVGASPVGPVPAPGTAPPVAAGEEELTVHVVGAVAQPGVVRVPAPARAVDAVEAAGGLLPEADPRQVNLARPLADGEQVAVPREGEPLPVPPAGPPGADAPTGAAGAAGAPLVDLNRADAATLQTLPGIGPVLAERIVQRREEVGPFERVDDLTTVSGIGTQVLDGLRERATV